MMRQVSLPSGTQQAEPDEASPALHPRAHPAVAERRHLTILFSDLSGSTAIAAGMEAEDYQDLLDRIRAAYRPVIAAHGGAIAQVSGDGVVAIFGHEHAREDDARRAVSAALDLHAAVRALAPANRMLAMHSGIHAGTVLLRAGDVEHGRYELTGDATNVASRLASTAGHDEILVSEATLGPERPLFRTGAPRRLQLRGHDAAVVVLRVTGRTAARTRFQASVHRGLSPFVGRSAELGRMTRAMDAVLAGYGRSITIAGPPGLGKTRLASEFARAAQAAGFAVHRGYCEAKSGARPLQPFVQMLRSLLPIDRGMAAKEVNAAVATMLADIDPLLSDHAETLAGLLGHAPPPPGAAASMALRDLFARLSAGNPLLLLLDDLQWIDDATHHALEAIHAIEARPILIVSTTRRLPEPGAIVQHGEIILLDPLTGTEADRAIAHLLPAIDPFARGEVRAYAGGNPLFLEELCHAVRRGEGGGRNGRLHGPDTWLRMLIESRFRLLPEREADLLRVAAVIGNSVPTHMLEAIAGASPDPQLLHVLAEQDFLYPVPGESLLRFKHGITHDTVYGSIGLTRRRALHRRVVEVLRAAPARDQDNAMLAHHLLAAGAVADAITPAEKAGDHAMRVAALDRAQTHYAAALDGLDSLPPRSGQDERWHAILDRYGLACVFDPAVDQLARFARGVEKAREADDPLALARAFYWWGYIHYGLGDARIATDRCEEALRVLAPLGDRPVVTAFRAQVGALLGQALASAGEYRLALALLDAALDGRGQPSHPLTLVGTAYALACRAQVLGDRGWFSAAHRDFEEALALVRGAGHPVEASVLGLCAAVCLWQGDNAAAARHAAESQRVGRRINSLFLYASASAINGYARWRLDRSPEALTQLRDATSWLAAARRSLFGSLNHGWLAEALIAEGRIAEGRRHAALAFSRARADDRLGEATAARALAHAAARGHGRRSPGDYLARAFACADARGSPHEQYETERCAARLNIGGMNQPISRSVSGAGPGLSTWPSITPAATPKSTPIAAS